MADVYHRQLAAILAADVVGYSRLMDQDEIRTFTRLKNTLRAIVEPTILRNSGLLINKFGDGLLVEFASVIDAVRCAIDIQTHVARAESDTPEVSRFTFRIGINLGDVIHDNNDIFGDGVNIAARLQTLAQPGEICVSGAVRDAVLGKLDVEFLNRGEQLVKNISTPVRVFAVCFDPAQWVTVPEEPAPLPDPAKRAAAYTTAPVFVGMAVAVIATLAFLAIGYATFQGASQRPLPAITAQSSPRVPVKAPAIPVHKTVAAPSSIESNVSSPIATPTANAVPAAKSRPQIPVDVDAVTSASNAMPSHDDSTPSP
jgi:class 3 adenylate cyclase